MKIEYNLSHDDTVKKWDDMILYNKEVFKQLSSMFFARTVDLYDQKHMTIENYNDQIHDIIHNIIKKQNDHREIQNSFFQAIISHCIAALWLFNDDPMLIVFDPSYIWEKQIEKSRKLMIEKNKNYGSSWSIMRPESITDVIHTKIHRTISLLEGEQNKFESIQDTFEDIINYCIFCLIRMELDKGE